MCLCCPRRDFNQRAQLTQSRFIAPIPLIWASKIEPANLPVCLVLTEPCSALFAGAASPWVHKFLGALCRCQCHRDTLRDFLGIDTNRDHVSPLSLVARAVRNCPHPR